ncbi:MAG TPA: ABC transporter permease [Candidatus Dormibacteraeota bacterium]|nr:ABC transporter permease [Candidatus Dormibacteraeota bacterium]
MIAARPDPIVDEFVLAPHVPVWRDVLRRVSRNRLAVVGAVIALVVVVMGILSNFWTPYPYWQQALGPTFQGPTRAHPLGLDAAGRDILSRVMLGAGISIEIGIGTSLLVSVVGVTLGLLAGYYRGKLDLVISTLINIWYGIPDLLVALIFVVLIGRGLQNIIFAITITRWMDMARLVRGQTLALREREFVEAARASGTRDRQILIGQILPNALGPIIVQATLIIPAAILLEAFLSYLGLGVQPPTPSWGAMAAQGFQALQLAPHIVLAPALALSVTLLAFNWLGDGLRDALDPRMRR